MKLFFGEGEKVTKKITCEMHKNVEIDIHICTFTILECIFEIVLRFKSNVLSHGLKCVLTFFYL